MIGCDSDGDSESIFCDSTRFCCFSLRNFWRFQTRDSGNRAARRSQFYAPLRGVHQRLCKICAVVQGVPSSGSSPLHWRRSLPSSHGPSLPTLPLPLPLTPPGSFCNAPGEGPGAEGWRERSLRAALRARPTSWVSRQRETVFLDNLSSIFPPPWPLQNANAITVRTVDRITDRTFIISEINQVINYRLRASLE